MVGGSGKGAGRGDVGCRTDDDAGDISWGTRDGITMVGGTGRGCDNFDCGKDISFKGSGTHIGDWGRGCFGTFVKGGAGGNMWISGTSRDGASLGCGVTRISGTHGALSWGDGMGAS